MKILINGCYGGFGLSNAVFEWLIKNKNWKCIEVIDDVSDEFVKQQKANCYRYSKNCKYKSLAGNYYFVGKGERTNKDIIEAVETLGVEAASASLASLKIVEIPDGTNYEIDDYDGIETIHEVHQSWS